MTKVLLGVSGGVDSALSIYLLQQQGFSVVGLFMQNWCSIEDNCSIDEDQDDARKVCRQFHIPLLESNGETLYWNHVFSYFISTYRAYQTPNPDVFCNSLVKFKQLVSYADQHQISYIATGHYAHIKEESGAFFLQQGLDQSKDQSYFLHRLEVSLFPRLIFPLGQWLKKDVRALAQKIGLSNAKKKDSTGICFVKEKNLKNLLYRHIQKKPGAIVTLDGVQVGTHQGMHHYTVGQRKGLNVGGMSDQTKPFYVLKKDAENNRLVVVEGKDHPMLFQTIVCFHQIHWLVKIDFPLHCEAKIRYRQQQSPCMVSLQNDQTLATFSIPQYAFSPGQFIVFYQQHICLGGGIIVS